jgi:peptidoglycan hydrolase-like protein with peptidoglycan-binding domain
MQSTMLTKAAAAAAILLAAGCADMRAPSGNQTSYATGSYRMPAKTQTAQAPAATDSRKVEAAQRALARAGYAPGAPGAMDAPTHDAVVQFQQKNGLRATGDLDSQTMSALGLQQ